MTSSKIYWQQREAEALKHYLTEEKEYQKRINEIYDRMLDDIQKEIDSFYARYADKEGITLAEAKKRVKTADIKEFERKAKRYVKEKNFSKQANEEMRLYNLMMKVNRLEMLKANIGLKLISNFDELNHFMEEILQDRTEEELERQAGILGNTIQNNAELAHMIVNASFHNATFSDRIWLYQDLMRDELGKLLEKGLIQGKNPRVLARELNKVFNTGKYNCERLMRTELARVQIEAQRQSYIKDGTTMFTFIANSDCCDVCKAINGRHFYVKDMLSGTNAPPMHPNCRCSTAPYTDRQEFEDWLDFISNGGTSEEWEKLKTIKINEKTPLQHYKPIMKDSNDTLTLQRNKKINVTRVSGYDDNKIYISDNVKIKRKQVHNINKRFNECIELLNMQDKGAKPNIVILSPNEMVSKAIASYNPVTNTLFVQPFLGDNAAQIEKITKGYASSENPLSTLLHESMHWQDAMDYIKQYGNIDDAREYFSYRNIKAEKELEKYGITLYNSTEISKYAHESFIKGKFDETYTEYKVKKMLKGKVKR